MSNQFDVRFAEHILRGEFSADDITDYGRITAHGDHDPNARQNTIGSMFQSHARQGHIHFTGRVIKSTSPHRKGGMIRIWVGTEKGKLWAREVLT